MKYTNYQLINIYNSLDSFSSKKFPQKISYAITKNIFRLQSDVECYDKELSKLFEKYSDKAIKDNDGNPIRNQLGLPVIEPEYSNDFNNELNELLNIEVDVDLYTIDDSLFDYDDKDGLYDALSASDLVKLQRILCVQDAK